MDAMFGGKLDEILSDGDTMQKLREIADTLSKNGDSPPPSESPQKPDVAAQATVLPSKVGGYCALLSALRPYLDSERRERVDKLIRALKMTDTAKNLIGF